MTEGGKPEPLKGKWLTQRQVKDAYHPSGIHNCLHYDEDIRSAVEWLNMKVTAQKLIKFEDSTSFALLLLEAFEDVMK